MEVRGLAQVADADVALRSRVEKDRSMVTEARRGDDLIFIGRPLPIVINQVVDTALASVLEVPKVDAIFVASKKVLEVRRQ